MNIIFMGTPDFALPSLRHLAGSSHRNNIRAVVTQPDRPRGRHLHHTYPPPVKQLAEELGLRVIQTDNVNEPDVLQELNNLSPDLIVVVAFGQRLSREFLEIPKIACINLHSSLLPKYRGAAPIIWAIVNGEEITGVTAQKVVYEMDAGDIISQEVVEIGPDDTAGDLEPKLSEVAGNLLMRVLEAYEHSNISYTPQQRESVSYAPRVRKKDGLINWNQSPDKIHNFIRGMNPKPGAFSFLSVEGGRPKKRLIILRSHLETQRGVQEMRDPGTIIDTSDKGIQVAADGGSLWITQLQTEGGGKMTAQEYLHGHRLGKGECFLSE
ncbi:MAG: methionyl-tRNA formyltransferase [Candidatus Brocadiales bacterium]